MDFIVGLPKLGNKLGIMVVVGCFSKVSQFYSLTHSSNPSLMPHAFMDYIFKIHGMPTSIISDRDPTFTNQFWHELFKVQGA
jgi:hypothetical protein